MQPSHGASAPANETAAAGLAVSASPAPAAGLHAVVIRPGPATPRVLATLPETGGVPAMVSCSTCHATRQPDLTNASGEAMNEFHQGLKYQHGGLSCLSCHHAGNYDTLRRADGTSIEFPNTIQLCAQCHGPQYRDYLNGSHGGMTGHWDLRVGGRVRNTCTDCHDAHAPAYPQVQPVFLPQDRGARQLRERAAPHPESTSPHG
jgi:formate-dependent nitrite reductase cytochrome c552 subunit